MSDDRFTPPPIGLDATALAAVYDELPLWSAPFGLALLAQVVLRPGLVAVDIGCGTGFPLLELAQRLGPAAVVHGVDPWAAALARVRARIAAWQIGNVVLHERGAEALPLADASVDLIVSNNGLNNVADLAQVLAECARVARPGAQLVYAYNLPASMHELYDALDAALARRGQDAARAAVQAHIAARRVPVATTVAALAGAGFAVARVQEDQFVLRFADATALFAHGFMRMAFIPGWQAVVPEALRAEVFAEVAAALDAGGDGVTLSIPFACIDARRADS